MKRACNWLNRIYASESGRWLVGAAAALALYLLANLLQTVITFYDNDDLNIAWALAGYRSGMPAFAHPFLNPVTAAAVSGLYTVFPTVPWWYAVQTACMLLSAAVMAACTLKLCQRNGLPLLVPLVVIVLVYGAACYYALTQVMFTLTSALLGMGAVALALAVDESDPPARRRFYLAASVVMIGLSLLIRQSSGLCAACFYFGALAIRLAEALFLRKDAAAESETPQAQPNHAAARRVLVTAACALLAVAALTVANAWGRANQHGENFLAFEEARAGFMDYPHDEYSENPALYESLGWDDSLYGLVSAWFYMDARVNADTLSAVRAQSRVNVLSAGARVSRGAQAFAVFLGKYPIAVYLCVITVCAALMLAAVALLMRVRSLSLAGGCGMLLGAAALLAYLLWQGRINLRTLMTVAFPAIFVLLLLAVRAYGDARRRLPADAGGRTSARKAALAGVCGVLMAVALFCGYKVFRTAVSYDSVETLASAHAVVDYVRAHPENVYIRDVYACNNFDALTVYPNDKPTNLIDWGGCDMYTRARLAQWRVNGYEESPYADVFLDENVYYVCDPNQPYLSMLDAYLRADWNAAGYAVVDGITDGAIVVKFLP